MNFQLQSNTVLVVAAVAVVAVGGWLMYRKGVAALAWVSDIPANIVAAAKDGGATFQAANTPNAINRTNTPDVYSGVFNDPLINDAGMDFRYF